MIINRLIRDDVLVEAFEKVYTLAMRTDINIASEIQIAVFDVAHNNCADQVAQQLLYDFADAS